MEACLYGVCTTVLSEVVGEHCEIATGIAAFLDYVGAMLEVQGVRDFFISEIGLGWSPQCAIYFIWVLEFTSNRTEHIWGML